MPEIQLKSVTKTYGNVNAVNQIDLRIENGQFTVLVGPSGCGKTTTLRLIAGLEQVSGGEIWFDDRCVTHYAPRDRDVAVVFQNYSLYGHLKVRDNLAFGLKARTASKDHIATTVRSIAQLLKIEHLLERRPAQLSGGERQRVAIGRALARNPNVFLFDEPLSSLDTALRIELRSEIIRLHQQFRNTTLYVTHDQAEAMCMADTLVVVDQGRILQSGPPLEVYHHPSNTFVARFIGSPPMNFIPGEMMSDSDDLVFQSCIGGYSLGRVLQSAFCQAGVDGKRYLLGIRPEEIALSPINKPSISFNGEISIIEALGAETLLLVHCNGIDLHVRTMENLKFQVGAPIRLHLNTDRFRLFLESDGQSVISDTILPSYN